MPEEELVIKRLALVFGAGPFANQIRSDVRTAGFDCDLFSWVSHPAEGEWIPLGDPQQCAAILREHGVSHVLHVGNFGPLHALLAVIRGNHAKSLLHAVTVRRRFFGEYSRALGAAGVTAIAPRDLFERYRPSYGQMGAVPPPADLLDDPEALKSRVASILRDRQPTLSVAQSVLFDGDGQYLVEQWGTDRLIERFAPSADARRMLVKICPAGVPPKLDAPTIGPVTIEKAAAHGVGVVAIDAEFGQLADKAATIEAANRLSIALIGL